MNAIYLLLDPRDVEGADLNSEGADLNLKVLSERLPDAGRVGLSKSYASRDGQ